ncbi:MAG: alpha/beta family hydrolase [Burkholderiales bacterium]
MQSGIQREQVRIGAIGAPGEFTLPPGASGLAVFAHGSGSSRLSPRNAFVAEALRGHGVGTLLFDLLSAAEAADRRKVFDIELLAQRVADALDWAAQHDAAARLPLGLFGASTGAAAALRAAAEHSGRVGAVVSRGGRPDLAGAAALARVDAPTLLIVGGDDTDVLALNREAMRQLRCPKRLEIVPGATHLFTEPGTLDAAAHLAGAWFANHLSSRRAA